MAVAPLYVNVITTQLPPRISSVVPRADTRGTWHSADSRVLVYEECWYSHAVPRLSDFVELKQKQFFISEILTICVYLVVPPRVRSMFFGQTKLMQIYSSGFFIKLGNLVDDGLMSKSHTVFHYRFCKSGVFFVLFC